MRIEVRLMIIALLMLAFTVLPAQAQYSEIYRLDKAVNGLDERVVLARLSGEALRSGRQTGAAENAVQSVVRTALHGARVSKSHE